MLENFEAIIKKKDREIDNLLYTIKTNMTSITRYVRHKREDHPSLTDGQFLDRNLKYKELADIAVSNILSIIKNIDSNNFKDKIAVTNTSENLYNADYRKIEGEPKNGHWIFKNDGAYGRTRCYCSICGKPNGIGGIRSNQAKPYCPNCGAKMDEENK